MSIKPLAMRDVLLDRIWRAMAEDQKIFFTSADFGSPVLDKIRADFPERFVNVGIAEQNLINVSAGLALEGYTVFAYAIAPFITMRCYEQIRVSLALLSEVRVHERQFDRCGGWLQLRGVRADPPVLRRPYVDARAT